MYCHTRFHTDSNICACFKGFIFSHAGCFLPFNGFFHVGAYGQVNIGRHLIRLSTDKGRVLDLQNWIWYKLSLTLPHLEELLGHTIVTGSVVCGLWENFLSHSGDLTYHHNTVLVNLPKPTFNVGEVE